MESRKLLQIKRHILIVRLIHWTNAFCFIGLIFIYFIFSYY